MDRSPSAIYITGRKGSPTEAAMTRPESFRDLNWWTWVAGGPAIKSDEGAVTPYADGLIIKLGDEFHNRIGLSETVMKAQGLLKTPFIRVGL